MTPSDAQVVTLRGGLVASLDALRVLWSLEDRGCSIRVTPAGSLLVGPREQLTDGDRAGIQKYKAELIRLVNYDADVEVA